MGWYCCVPRCKNRFTNSENDKLSMHSFPSDIRLRNLWLIKIKRDIGVNFKITHNTKVCSAHFVCDDFKPLLHTKKKLLKLGAVPSVFDWLNLREPTSREIRCKKRKLEALKGIENIPCDGVMDEIGLLACEQVPNKHVKERMSSSSNMLDKETLAAETLLLLSASTSVPHAENIINDQQNILQAQLNDEKVKNCELEEKVQILERKIKVMGATISSKENQISHLKKKDFSIQNISKCPEVFSSYTGLPNYGTFSALVKYLRPKAQTMVYWRGNNTKVCESKAIKSKPGIKRLLSTEEEFFMVLIRLRLGTPIIELAWLFGLSSTNVSTIFITWINLLYLEFRDIFHIPNRPTIKKATPKQFTEYPNTTLILDYGD